EQLTVVVVEHVVGGADHRPGRGRLAAADPGQLLAAQRLVAGVAVGQADQLHDMAGGAVQRGQAAGGGVGGVGGGAEDGQAEGGDGVQASGGPVRRSWASRYLARVRATTSGGNSGGGLFLSQPVFSSQSRTYCLSNEGGLPPGR